MSADRDSLARHRAYSLLMITVLLLTAALLLMLITPAAPGVTFGTAVAAGAALVTAATVRPRGGGRR
ncbi:hypothetical protein [Amycolatopsis thermophila]|uniref:Secreted protein n=1 Tax=Amycolatopsis thermophila TaxID=206084 RepID=A0ABU0EN13_9PSEU|nr:hypothetical protein [Amycolatopsis thermophila]MDQ0376554.1 hypothetical protein [Amycolatopsis thermophila]